MSSSEQVAKSRETLTPRPIDRGVRIGHVHLKVADLERALRFYCGVLGFELTQRRSGAAFVSCVTTCWSVFAATAVPLSKRTR